MNRLVYFLLSLPLLLVFTTSAHAGPACARRNEGTDACIQKCGSKWGWPGSVMGTDRWGQVLTKTVTDDMGAVATKACRVRSSGLPSASTTSIASSTSPLLIPPASVAPANVIVTASVSTVTPAAPTISVKALTHSSANTTSSTRKVSLAPFVASSTAPASKSRLTTSIKPTTSSTSTTHSTTSTSTTIHTTTSHSEAPPPPPPTSTTTKKTTTQQPQATANASSGSSNGNSGSSSSSGSGDSSSGATSQSDIDQYLQAHNSIRAQHGASDLTWSDNLAAKAQQWANGCVFQHSGGTLGPFGENLAAGTGSSYDIQAAVKSWTDEVSEYDPSNPQPSHFTQVVWKASTQVGCAVQSCNGIFAASFGPAKYFVCEYSVQGNVIGQFGQNVQA